MVNPWLSIKVDLVSGRGEEFWPRPGRLYLAAQSHTFLDLSIAIDNTFARWDLGHSSQFLLSDGTLITDTDPDNDAPVGAIDFDATPLSRLAPGDLFAYTFDFGDNWEHLCSVHDDYVDPERMFGSTPPHLVAYWGWGAMPDQYGRRWLEDDLEGPIPPDPEGRDLPEFHRPWQWSDKPF